MADDEVRVWVKTSAIEEVLFGKPKSSCHRRSLAEGGGADNNGGICNWGWARATRIRESGSSKSSPVKVCINDEESEYHQQTISIPSEKASETVVMDNIWESEEDQGFQNNNDGRAASGGPPDDLISLTHLHEPAVVHCLRTRYANDQIYTSTGPILLALNPFKNLKSLYSSKVRQQYVGRGERRAIVGEFADDHCDELPPHVYGLADFAFRSMMKQFEQHHHEGSASRSIRTTGETGQSILVSGESGAGKTVTTKFILQYLASLSERSSGRGGNKSKRRPSDDSHSTLLATSSIEQQVLQSNPILESFGNARTIRNDNSSRFGKFIELTFQNSGILCGASIQTYLLEKVRLVTQAPGERNYHIFYELLVGLDESDLDKYYLTNMTAEDFRLTNSSGTYDRRDGVDDYDTFEDLQKAMHTMGFDKIERENILSVTSALLHCSNLDFIAISADECEIKRDSSSLEPILSLLGFTVEALNRALCYFSIKAGKETHTRSLPKAKAAKGLLGLIKATYGALFSHIVGRVNSSIHVKDSGGSGRGVGRGSSKQGRVGILDIFGFESFHKNSFEQLCINYCNEALQQQFNLFVLKKEQEEYQREGIQWSFIEFPDNQDVLDLIWKKGAGILNILDDQCRAPGTTDKTFATDLYKKCTSNARFQADYRQVGSRLFGVVHYAGSVEYDTEGFVEKNRDEVPREATELLQSSSCEFVQFLGEIISIGSAQPPAKDQRISSGSSVCSVTSRAGTRQTNTVGSQFAQQLTELRQKIDSTCPHYVRCLKPNDILVPDYFDPVIIADQLRCAGVIEAVRVSRVGYPQRYSHSSFLKRYKTVALKELKQISKSSRTRLKTCDALVFAIAKRLQQMDPSLKSSDEKDVSVADLLEVGMQIGKTKVFLRSHAYEMIEHLRHESMDVAAIKMQSIGRMRLTRNDFLSLRKSSLTVQCFFRRKKAERLVSHIRRNYYSTVIQRSIRGVVRRRYFVAILAMSRWTQTKQRQIKARELYGILKERKKASFLQKWWKMAHLRHTYEAKRKRCALLQRSYRCALSKRTLKSLKLQQRDLHAVAEERDLLRSTVQNLRSELEKTLQSFREMKEVSAGANSAETEMLQRENEEIRSLLSIAQSSLQEEKDRASEALRLVARTENSLETLQGNYDRLNVDLQKTKLALSFKEEQFENLEQSTTMLRKEFDDFQLKSAELEQVNNGNIENAHRENEILRKELQEAQCSIFSKEETIRTLEQKNLDFKKQLEDIQRQCAKAAQVNEDLEKKLLVESSKSAAMAAENISYTTNAGNLYESRATGNVDVVPQDQRDALREELKSLQAELVTSKTNNEEKLRLSEAELDKANEENSALKSTIKKLESANEKVELQHNGKSISIPGHLSQGDVDYLQQTVLRLEGELEAAKNISTTIPTYDPNSSEHLLARYDELRKLSEIIVAKDQEIDNLRLENKQLQEDITSKPQSSNQTKVEVDEASSLGFSDAADGTKTETDPFFFLRRKRSSLSHSVGRTPNKEDEDALKIINEFLRLEVETLRKKLDATDKQLAEERKKSAEDLQAFSEALRGVDQLRAAAESMSRELARAKRREKFSKMMSGKWDPASLQNEVDDNFSVLSGGTSLLQEAQEKLTKSGKKPTWGFLKR